MKLRRVVDWIEDRTGLVSSGREFLAEPMPPNVGWQNTLGSVVGGLLILQIVTGCLMLFFYVPHPESAYQSIQFIEQRLIGGGFIRSLHHWGVGFILVALFLHVLRVFYRGAYRPPREATWLVGLALLGTVVGLAFTGQLLPWNQRGYWATEVGIQIASSAPVVGPLIERMLVGGDTVGVLTMTRFYAMHVVILPAALGALIILHLYLLRRHGPAGGETDTPAGAEAPHEAPDASREATTFFPYQTGRDAIALSGGIVLLCAVAAIAGTPDSALADPADTSYVPRPEWYFLGHYELLRFTPGSLKIVATFIIPTLAGVALVLLPWLDRGSNRRLITRVGGLAAASLVTLTLFGMFAHGSESEASVPDGAQYDPVAAGRLLFDELGCRNCHAIHGEGQDFGPDLSNVGDRLQPEYLRRWIADPQSIDPDTAMPATKGTRRQIDEVASYLETLKAER